MTEQTKKTFYYLEFIAVLAIFVFPAILPQEGISYWASKNSSIDLNFPISNIISALIRCSILSLLCAYHSIFQKFCNHKKEIKRDFISILCVVSFFLLLIPSLILTYLGGSSAKVSPSTNYFYTFFSVILFATQEELIFRFYLPETYKKLKLPCPKFGEVLAIFLFGISHHPNGLFSVFFSIYSGVILRLLVIKTYKNPVFSSAIHSLYNITVFLLLTISQH